MPLTPLRVHPSAANSPIVASIGTFHNGCGLFAARAYAVVPVCAIGLFTVDCGHVPAMSSYLERRPRQLCRDSQVSGNTCISILLCALLDLPCVRCMRCTEAQTCPHCGPVSPLTRAGAGRPTESIEASRSISHKSSRCPRTPVTGPSGWWLCRRELSNLQQCQLSSTHSGSWPARGRPCRDGMARWYSWPCCAPRHGHQPGRATGRPRIPAAVHHLWHASTAIR